MSSDSPCACQGVKMSPGGCATITSHIMVHCAMVSRCGLMTLSHDGRATMSFEVSRHLDSHAMLSYSGWAKMSQALAVMPPGHGWATMSHFGHATLSFLHLRHGVTWQRHRRRVGASFHILWVVGRIQDLVWRRSVWTWQKPMQPRIPSEESSSRRPSR